MNKSIALALALLGLGSLWAEKPRRYVEAGFTVAGGFANNYLGYGDFFNDQRILRIDLNKMGRYNFNLLADLEARTFFTVRGETFTVGLFAGAEGMFYGDLSKELFQLLRDGNTSRYAKAEFAFGGSLFADTGVQVEAVVGKLRLHISPAVFVPLVYIPRPKMALTVKTGEDTMSMTGAVALDMYSPVRLGTGTGDVGSLDMDIASLPRILDSGALGVDLTLGVEYPLASWVDGGILVNHIPIALSRLTHQTRLRADFGFNDQNSELPLLDMLKEGRIDEILHIGDPEFSFSRGVYYVSRPMRFDLYGRLRVLSDWLVLCPQVGVSLFTPYGDIPCFNAGITGQLRVKRLVQLSLGTGYEELVWKHRLGFMLNLRVVQIDLGVTMQSQDFIHSFGLNGLGAALGVYVGF
jgi:hypothetical protein